MPFFYQYQHLIKSYTTQLEIHYILQSFQKEIITVKVRASNETRYYFIYYLLIFKQKQPYLNQILSKISLTVKDLHLSRLLVPFRIKLK